MENKRSIGNEKENLAALYFSQTGYDIVEKNFYSRFGEIDLVVKKEDTLVFAEVKYRKNERNPDLPNRRHSFFYVPQLLTHSRCPESLHSDQIQMA